MSEVVDAKASLSCMLGHRVPVPALALLGAGDLAGHEVLAAAGLVGSLVANAPVDVRRAVQPALFSDAPPQGLG